MSAVAEQISRELDDMLTGAALELLGPDAARVVHTAIADRSAELAAQLDSGDIDVARQLMAALWPRVHPEDTPLGGEWWRTPLGVSVARTLAPVESGSATHRQAAAMLGLSAKSIGTEITRGRLERHHDRGVARSSILARIAAP